jgi:hypothetical protein
MIMLIQTLLFLCANGHFEQPGSPGYDRMNLAQFLEAPDFEALTRPTGHFTRQTPKRINAPFDVINRSALRYQRAPDLVLLNDE